MGWISEVGSLLQKYDTDHLPEGDEELESNFGRIVQAAPPDKLSPGITEAFRSDRTPPFEEIISKLFSRSNTSQKACLLNTLLQQGGGPLAQLVLRRLGMSEKTEDTGQRDTITPEQANMVDPGAVRDLASQIEKEDPSIIDRAGEFYSQHPSLVKNLGGAALAIVLAKMARNARSI